MNQITVIRADYENPRHGDDIISLMRDYAKDPMGSNADLPDHVQQNLMAGMAQAGGYSVLAYDGETAVGLANCFWGFSTFKAKPLVNIHDVAVRSGQRGKGIGRKLFAALEKIAQEEGACKITLEVLVKNENAKGLYASLGYGGDYHFWQKELS